MEENNFPGFIMIFHRNWQFATNFVVVLEKMSFCQFPATSDDSCGTLPVPMQTRNCVWHSYSTREEVDTVQVLRSWRCSRRRRGTSFNARKQWKSNTHNKLPLPEVSRWGRVIEQLLFRLQFNRVQECFCVKFDKLLLFPFPHPPAPSMLVVWGWFMVDWGGHK